jgi:D-alanyl-D-alanine carboxypeptidase
MRHRYLRACSVGLWLVAVVVVRADDTDNFIRAEMQQKNIPGLSLVVLKHGEVIKSQGYGLANRALKTPAAPDTVYKIASVSKQFMATGIMVLVQQGRVRVDAPVRTYLPDAPEAWNDISVRHLLTHTAGLVREPPGFDPFKTTSDSELLRTAYPVPLRFKPGDKWEYSNTGYNALAEIIRIVSGKPWPEFIHDAVFKPAGMTSTWPTNTPRSSRTALNATLTTTGCSTNRSGWLCVRAAGSCLPCWIWQSGTPHFTRTRSSPTRAAARCGRR